jgi:uncharacterized membrane protein
MVRGTEEPVNDDSVTAPDADRRERAHPVVLAAIALLSLEALALAAVTIYLVVEILVSPAASIASAVALAVVAALAATWVVAMVVGVVRGNAWVRAGAVVLQVLFIAVAVGSVQGDSPRPELAVAIAVPAIVTFFLVFSKPFVMATSRRDGDAVH